MKKLSFIAVAICAVALIFAACGDKQFRGYSKTDSGLHYKITTKNDKGNAPKEGDYLFLIVSFTADFDTTLNFPTLEIADVMRESLYPGDVYEAYSLLKEGEEGEFYIKADSFFYYMMGQIPPSVKPESLLHFNIKLNEIKSAEQYEADMSIQEQERKEMFEKRREEEGTVLAQYIKEQNITVKPTASGLYFIETLKGTGAKAENGKKVTVHYTGKLLDGTIFDSSENHGQPLEFVLGSEPMIPGFVEGLLLIKEGGKATFILPSSLAYGERGGGEIIPPFTPIIFDVELTKVE